MPASPFVSGEGTAYPGPASMRDPTLLGRGDFRTWIIPTGSVSFPVSRTSRALNMFATVVGLGVRQQLKLLGSEAPSLNYLFITVSERWTHALREGRAGERNDLPSPAWCPTISRTRSS